MPIKVLVPLTTKLEGVFPVAVMVAVPAMVRACMV